MSKKQTNEVSKFKVVFIFCLFVLGGVILLLSSLLNQENNKEAVVSPETGIEEAQTIETGEIEELDDIYSPDPDKDPFLENETEEVTVQELSFEPPVSMDFYMEENTGSTLTSATDNILLFQSFGDVSYIYHKDNGEQYVIDQDIKQSLLCSNQKHVAYISTYETDSHKIFSYDVGNGISSELFTAGINESITAITCDDTRIYFTVEDTKGKKTAKIVALSQYMTELKPSQFLLTVDNASDYIMKNKNDVFVYVPTKNIFKSMNDVGIDHDIPAIFKEKVSDVYSFDINDANQWASLYYNEENIVELAVNGEKIDGFTSLNIAKWYDEKRLLVLDIDTLYLYDIKTKQKEVIKTEVADFIVSDGNIYFHNTMGELSLIKKK